MAIILGLDPSITKTGFCVLDTEAPFSAFIKRGRLRTSLRDGHITLRLLKQQNQIKELMEEYSIDFVAMEAPYFGGGEAEELFALNQFIHQIFYNRGTYVVAFPPSQLKVLSLPTLDPKETGKNHFVMVAQERYDLLGVTLADDEADALNAGFVGKIYYRYLFEKKYTKDDLLTIGERLHPDVGAIGKHICFINKEYVTKLGPKIHKAFVGTHTYTRGAKKGITEYKGLQYRENELFWDYTAIKERMVKQNKLIGVAYDCKKSSKKSNKKSS